MGQVNQQSSPRLWKVKIQEKLKKSYCFMQLEAPSHKRGIHAVGSSRHCFQTQMPNSRVRENILIVFSNNMLFNIHFEMNWDIHIIQSVDSGGLSPLSALLTECTAEKQHSRKRASCVLLPHSAQVLGKKRTRRANQPRSTFEKVWIL